MDIVQIVKLVYLILGMIGMGFGVYTDIRERKFPNSILVDVIVVGLLYALYSGHLLESIFGFILMNIIGVFFHRYHLISAGDMKFLSVIFLFISIRDIDLCMTFLLALLVTMLAYFCSFYRQRNMSLLQEIKKGLFSIKALLLFKINTFSELKFDSKKEMLEKTVPMTLPIYIAFVITMVSQAIIMIL